MTNIMMTVKLQKLKPKKNNLSQNIPGLHQNSATSSAPPVNILNHL